MGARHQYGLADLTQLHGQVVTVNILGANEREAVDTVAILFALTARTTATKTLSGIAMQMFVLTQRERGLGQAEAGNRQQYLPPHCDGSVDCNLVWQPAFLNYLYSRLVA
jgi:hypothetical protein